MKKGYVIAAVVLIAAGIAVFGGFFFASGFDFSKLDSSHCETKLYSVDEAFDGIEIDISETDVVFEPSEDGRARVECTERDKVKYGVSVENGVLKIVGDDRRAWYDRLSLYSNALKMTVYLPRDRFGSLKIDAGTGKVDVPGNFSFADADIEVSTGDVTCGASADGLLRIKTSTGDITLAGAEAGQAELTVSTGGVDAESAACAGTLTVNVGTGKTRLTDVKCGNLVCGGSTGDIILKDVVASDGFDIKASTGDVRFDNCDAGRITVKTSTGSVTGTLRTEKVFIAKTSTGKIDVPDTVSGGRCELTTSTGDIRIKLSGE